MALFDLPAYNQYIDYNTYSSIYRSAKIDAAIIHGKTEQCKTVTQISAYVGNDTYSIINELIF